MTFHPDILPNLTGKTYIVTGGSSGTPTPTYIQRHIPQSNRDQLEATPPSPASANTTPRASYPQNPHYTASSTTPASWPPRPSPAASAPHSENPAVWERAGR
ncbi:uncharacterized protein LDX57_003378 [Aspergillus melleus]|uniref:uncharacterized protein n=1 Tax=Aspergillus melleus TaxID=138277 RepID=UPI001E8EE2C0|nr:uncharacterized protein LDX57_003378 [Aspergillus melleus]KAH8425629.1 hypothetical protein LDX57_003378 [Aspergillus melleus]